MKQILSALFLLSSTLVFAQNGRYDRNQPPNTVQQNFQRDNPNRNEVKWSYENNQWRARYKDDNSRDVDDYYDRYGRRRDTHVYWQRSDMPQDLDRNIDRRYHTNGNYRVIRIERPNTEPLFQITFRSGRRDRTVYMDKDGHNRDYNDYHRDYRDNRYPNDRH